MLRRSLRACVLLAAAGTSGCRAQPAPDRGEACARAESDTASAPRWTVERDGDQAVRVSPSGGRSTPVEASADDLSRRAVGGGSVEVRVSCGSPCSASLYVSTEIGWASEPFLDTLAVDPARERVAVPMLGGVAA